MPKQFKVTQADVKDYADFDSIVKENPSAILFALYYKQLSDLHDYLTEDIEHCPAKLDKTALVILHELFDFMMEKFSSIISAYISCDAEKPLMVTSLAKLTDHDAPYSVDEMRAFFIAILTAVESVKQGEQIREQLKDVASFYEDLTRGLSAQE